MEPLKNLKKLERKKVVELGKWLKCKKVIDMMSAVFKTDKTDKEIFDFTDQMNNSILTFQKLEVDSLFRKLIILTFTLANSLGNHFNTQYLPLCIL